MVGSFFFLSNTRRRDGESAACLVNIHETIAFSRTPPFDINNVYATQFCGNTAKIMGLMIAKEL